jgi:hypothetical protein
VDEFLQNGQNLLEAAQAARQAGSAGEPLSVLVGPGAAIRTFCGSDWPLESLAREHGARFAYRVSHRGPAVRVEGRGHGLTLVLEQTLPGIPRHPRLW